MKKKIVKKKLVQCIKQIGIIVFCKMSITLHKAMVFDTNH